MDWSYTEMEWTSFYTMQGLDLDTEQIIVLITQQANTWSLRWALIRNIHTITREILKIYIKRTQRICELRTVLSRVKPEDLTQYRAVINSATTKKSTFIAYDTYLVMWLSIEKRYSKSVQ